MYFKINPPQKDKYTDMGMINISADFYLEKGDEGWEKYQVEYHVTVPVIPEEGYPRQKEFDMVFTSKEQNAYREQQTLISTFPDEKKVIDGEEIIFPIYPDRFVLLENPMLEEYALYNKWVAALPTEERDNPFCNHSIQFEHDVTEEEILWCFEWALAVTHQNYLLDDLHCKSGGRVVNKDINYLARKSFYNGISIIPDRNKTDYMKTEMAKVGFADTKISQLPSDFTTIKTITKYSVK